MTKKFGVSVIVVCAPVEPTDGDSSDSDEFSGSKQTGSQVEI